MWLCAGSGACAAGLVIGAVAEASGAGWAASVMARVLGAGAVAGVIGAGSVRMAARMGRALSAGPWVACVAVDLPSALWAPRVVLRAPDTGELWVFTVVAVRRRLQWAEPGPSGVLWWCGDPQRGGVLAQPGGETLLWVRPTRTLRRRQEAVRAAEASGRLGRPSPQQPQQAERSQQAEPAPLGSSAVRAAGAQVPRRRPVFRWIALLGVAAGGLGIAGIVAADGDPQIDLTVLKEDSAGNCTVTWKDPDDGRLRKGPFRCTPDRDPSLSDWDTGWVVSYGPWKGELYNAEWEGATANTVNDGLLAAGFLLPVGAAVGGGIRVVQRRADRRVEQRATALAAEWATAAERPGVSLVKSPTGVSLHKSPAEDGPDRPELPELPE